MYAEREILLETHATTQTRLNIYYETSHLSKYLYNLISFRCNFSFLDRPNCKLAPFLLQTNPDWKAFIECD